MKKKESRREHNPVQTASDGASHKAGQLAPPEEQVTKNLRPNSNDEGVISVDTGNLNLAGDLTEREDKNSHILGLEPVALVILIFALAFIALIIYFISNEPPNTGPRAAPTNETQYRNTMRESRVRDHPFPV